MFEGGQRVGVTEDRCGARAESRSLEVLMQALIASVVGYAAEMGVFFAAAAALTAGALVVR
jgi:hypothetical protein